MTNREKNELRLLAKAGYSLREIRLSEVLCCSDSTIRRYIKVFGKKEKQNEKD